MPFRQEEPTNGPHVSYRHSKSVPLKRSIRPPLTGESTLLCSSRRGQRVHVRGEIDGTLMQAILVLLDALAEAL